MSYNKIFDTIQQILSLYANINTANTALAAKFKSLRTLVDAIIKKEQKLKLALTNKKPRKPSGFALPVPISDVLCDFLKLPHGSHLARTAVTKHINQYIKDNNLLSPTNKKHILPDHALATILQQFYHNNPNTPLTHFNLQKFINIHFLPPPSA